MLAYAVGLCTVLCKTAANVTHGVERAPVATLSRCMHVQITVYVKGELVPSTVGDRVRRRTMQTVSLLAYIELCAARAGVDYAQANL